MHHSQKPWLTNEEMKAVQDALGATSRFPLGKMHESDEGEIAFRVFQRSGKVILDFGPKPIAWVGMTAEQAETLADMLRQHAAAAR